MTTSLERLEGECGEELRRIVGGIGVSHYSCYDHLIHLDCYRLEAGEELLSLGWHETATNPKNLIFLEWPEQAESVLPLRVYRITFEVLGETERKITVDDRLM